MRTISCILFLFFLPSCIGEKETLCNNHLCFVYDYNLQYTDLFAQEINQLTVFIFDQHGELYQIYTDEATETFPVGYTMPLKLEEEEEYTVIVWSGLDENFNTPSPTRLHTWDDLIIQLNPDEEEDAAIKRRVPAIWHGKLENKWSKSSPQTVHLTKNSNTIRVIMKNLDDEGDEMDMRDFDIILTSSNGIYNSGNEPLNDTYKYYPYHTSNDPETGAIAELTTLRLMAHQENLLEIIHRESGENILGRKININTYLDALRLAKYDHLPLQEYLDRENHYGIVFLYKGFNKETHTFAHFNIQINGWYMREQDI